MSEWRSIETAPRDGTEVLGWRRDCGIILMRYSAPIDFLSENELEDMDEESAEAPDWMAADFISGSRMDGSETPTHWMPLPDPPEMKESKDTITDRAIHWLISGDTGLSSVAILRHMIGADGDKESYPRDPSDLGRCLRLLEHMPEWGERISEMSEHGPEWAGLVSRWQSIRSTMIREVGIDWSHGGRAPETYRAMQSAIADGRTWGEVPA